MNLLLISDSPELGGRVADAIGSQIALISGPEVPSGAPQLFQQLGPGAPIP